MFTIGGTSNRGFYPYEPTGSLRFEDGDSPYLQRTPTTAGNRKTWTFSAWVKRGNSVDFGALFTAWSADSGDNYYVIRFDSDQLVFKNWSTTFRKTSAVFRDFSAWYHIVISADTTQATAADRIKIYVNGDEVTSFSTSNDITQNTDTSVSNTNIHTIGTNYFTSASQYEFDGYMSEIYLVDGTAHDADAFGELKNGVWVPKDASGSLTFGTNGFYLPLNSTVTAEGQSTVLYEGTGATRSVEGFGYKPDLVWFKNRTNVKDHNLFDRVRGTEKELFSNDTGAENTLANSLMSFNSDGVTLGTATRANESGQEFVAWAWDAGADQTPTGFGCVTFTGSGGRRPVRDVGFTPDLLWFKQRNGTSDHALFDSVRGADKGLVSSSTAAQTTSNSGNDLVSFDSDGATTGTPQNYGSLGGSGNDIVAWAWDAGDGDPASNTDGDITSTVKASDTHGFSIVNYTGTGALGTVGHGLSTAPDFVIRRVYDGSWSWLVYHSALGSNEYLILNTTAAAVDDAGFMNDTDPTSSVMTVNTFGSDNNSGGDAIAYCWTEKSGYSKFGSYTGNGSATGPTVTLGFRPALVAIKRSDSTGNWYFFDTTRDPDNKGQRYLIPNSSGAEGGSGTGTEYIDFQSNGFQIIASGADFGEGNTSGGTYLYMAFAGGLDSIAPVNTDGDIDSRVKASDDTGFSIVRYDGSGTADDGVGHGLSSTPDVVFCKRLDATSSWRVQAYSTLGAKFLDLNTTAAADSSQYNQVWGATAPSSSVIHVGGSADVTQTNASGGDYIMYCWTATTGKSAFGSYTGNGSTSFGSGVSVNIGFRPALVIIKNVDQANGWHIVDYFRETTDRNGNYLWADSSSAEQTYEWLEFTDTGFEVINGTGNNNNNIDYVYMAFADGRDASFFHDESGQDNNFEPENLQNYDVVPDSPTNNFAVMNVLDKGSDFSTSEGNLKAATGGSSVGKMRATMGMSSGKWYWEVLIDYTGTAHAIGISTNSSSLTTYLGADSGDYAYWRTGLKANNASSASYGDSFADGDILSVAYDADAGTLEFYRNGVSQGDAYTGLSGTFFPSLGDIAGTDDVQYIVNFGQDDSFAGTVTPGGYTDANERGAFKYPVPDGFLSLCTANLPEPDISPANGQEPADYFNTVLWTGDNGTQAITDVGFAPDLVWLKNRTTAYTHLLYDTLRGAGTLKAISSSETTAEGGLSDNATFGYLSTLDSNGFTVVSGSTANSYTNSNSNAYVAWNWLAGGTAVSNTDGSITSSVSANTKAGFSIISYTGNGTAGATIGHGLDSPPEIAFHKVRNQTNQWHVGGDYIGDWAKHLHLDLSNAETSSTEWNSTAPSSSVITLGSGSGTNWNNNTFICYAFHSVEGYSKVGSYTGNGSSDGPMVVTGFRPAWVLIKRTDSAVSWYIHDNKRDDFNEVDLRLVSDASVAEASEQPRDYLSNGFKIRTSDGGTNASGGTYIFIAFAEMPFKYSQAR